MSEILVMSHFFQNNESLSMIEDLLKPMKPDETAGKTILEMCSVVVRVC